MQWRPLVTGIYTANRGLWKGVRHLQTLYARGCSAAYCKNISVILLPRPTNGFYCIFMQGCCMRHVCIIFNECVIEGIFGCKTLSEWNLWKEKNHKCVVRFLKKRCSKFICRVMFAWIRFLWKYAVFSQKWRLRWDKTKETLNCVTLLLTFLPDIQIQCHWCRWCQKHGLPFVCLPVAVIVELIVGGESDEASPSSRQREEDLSGCVFPHLTKEEVAGKKKEKKRRDGTGRINGAKHIVGWIKPAGVGYLCIVQLLPLWCDKIEDAVKGAGEGHSSDEQDDQHHVGKCGCEINHLSGEGTREDEWRTERENATKEMWQLVR